MASHRIEWHEKRDRFRSDYLPMLLMGGIGLLVASIAFRFYALFVGMVIVVPFVWGMTRATEWFRRRSFERRMAEAPADWFFAGGCYVSHGRVDGLQKALVPSPLSLGYGKQLEVVVDRDGVHIWRKDGTVLDLVWRGIHSVTGTTAWGRGGRSTDVSVVMDDDTVYSVTHYGGTMLLDAVEKATQPFR